MTSKLEKDNAQKLKESEERYKAFVAHSSEGIWRFELEKPLSINLPPDQQIDLFYQDAYLAECNDVVAKMYGYTHAEEIIGARLQDMLPREDPENITYLLNFIHSDYRLEDAQSNEKDKYNKDRYFLNNLVGIVENGLLKRAWGTQRDITERVELDKRKDEFIGIASHELKTPVTSLKAYLQVLQHRFRKQGHTQAAELLGKMDTQVNKLTSLIRNLLDITKMEEGALVLQKSQINVDILIKEIVDQMQLTTEDHIIEIVGHTNATIHSDRERVEQVVTNLISNAIKYSPKTTKIIVKLSKTKANLQISIQDFGQGIPLDKQTRIFERFYRLEDHASETYPGLGLGLYISSQIIKRLNGKIWVESLVGQGSTFYITLPIM
jgi:signal transduction histidine kinase